MIFSNEFIWWITIIELPALTALALLIWRTRIEAQQATSNTADRAKAMLDDLRAELALFKLDVARSYASVALLKDTEKRLTHHLLRIEAKLDNTVFNRAEDNLFRRDHDNQS
jgi:hypothetical protein